MSYRNPQTVIDTESAKYYAQAISNIGKLTAGVITNIDEKRRQEAKARKKRNLADTKNETEYSSDWLETTNKGISAAPINLQNDLRKLLDPKITEAAKIDTQLDNFSRGVGINLDGTAVDPNETSEQAFARKNGYIEEKNSLETLFTLGTKSALENLIQNYNFWLDKLKVPVIKIDAHSIHYDNEKLLLKNLSSLLKSALS